MKRNSKIGYDNKRIRITSLLRKSIYQLNHNEDHLLIDESVNGNLVIAVMDGCGSASESHWASGLIGKLVKNAVTRINEQPESFSTDELARSIFEHVFHSMISAKKLMGLDEMELFSTLLLAVINPDNRTFTLLKSGDGLYAMDENFQEIDQNNTPDFMAYHFELPFVEYFDEHVIKISGSFNKRFLLSTDGILKMNDLERTKTKEWLVENGLLSIMKEPVQKNSLKKRYDFLRQKHQMYPMDDLAMIAIEIS